MKEEVKVDSRETDSRKRKAKKHFENIVIEKLDVGDYVYKDVAIEFKTVEDFIGSVKSRRIYNQAINMSEQFNHHYIIVYGDVTGTLKRLYHLKHRFSINSYLGAIASLSQITKVIQVENESQAFKIAKSLFKKSTDGKNRTAKAPSVGKHENKIVTVLSLVGDINSTRAEKLVDELNITSLNGLLNLTEEEITSVYGFGEKTAKNIIKWLND